MATIGNLFAGILAAAVTAAGGGIPTADAGILLQKANETMLQVENMSVVVERQMDVDFDGKITSTIMQSEIDTVAEPFKANAEVTVMRNNEVTQRYGMYAIENEDDLDTYSEMEGQWVHATEMMTDISQYDIWTQRERFLKNMSMLAADGTEEINGIQTVKISGRLTGEAVMDVLEKSGIDLVFGGLGWSLEELKTELKTMKELPVILWISPEGHLLRYEFDMTKGMQAALDSLSGTEENFQTIVETKLRVTCSDFNQVPDVEIPQEILSGAMEFGEVCQENL